MSIDVNSKGISYPAQFGILSGFTLGGFIVAGLLTVVTWFLMAGTSIPINANEMLQPKYYNENMVIQSLSSFFIFFVPVYFFSLVCYHRPLQYIGFKTSATQKQILLVICILLLTLPFSGGLATFNKWIPLPVKWTDYFTKMEAERGAQEAALVQISSFSKFIISIFTIAFFPALFEETFFRGGLQKLFTKWFKAPYIAIIFTSIIFSLIHLSYYGFLVRFALGVVLGLIYYYSGSIWLNILMHFLYNGIQVIVLYVYSSKPSNAQPDLQNAFSNSIAVLSLIVMIYLIYKFIKISPKPEDLYLTGPKNDFDNWTQKNLN